MCRDHGRWAATRRASRLTPLLNVTSAAFAPTLRFTGRAGLGEAISPVGGPIGTEPIASAPG